MKPARLKGRVPRQLMLEGRSELIRALYRDGLPGVLSTEARPLGTSLIADLLTLPRTTVSRAIASDRPAPEPAPATTPTGS